MGLQSALSTALTGLTAAETSIDVAGNNVANANTVGFKESKVSFATQFLQTQSIGSAPTDGRGGTNPRQIGLGVKVAEISPEFTQGTIQISSNPLDTAIQGDGFFMVQGSQGERLFTRNGQFKTNAKNEIVTITGNRVLGYTVDDDYQLEKTSIVPLSIPLGSAAVAQATQNVFLEGSLNPYGTIGKTPEIIQSAILSDGAFEVPTNTTDDPQALGRPLETTQTAGNAAGSIDAGEYSYRVTWIDTHGNEGPASLLTPSRTIDGSTERGIDLSNIPTPPSGSVYTGTRIYRARVDSGASTSEQQYRRVGDIGATATTYSDAASNASLASATVLDDGGLSSNSYSYYVTFYNPVSGEESRPTPRLGPVTTEESTSPRVLLTDLPTPSGNVATGGFTGIRIYRNVAGTEDFHRIATLSASDIAAFGTDPITYIDKAPDSAITAQPEVNLEGPDIKSTTLVSQLYTRQGANYVRLFDIPSGQNATLSFTGSKGGRSVGERDLTITPTTTVSDLYTFMQQTMGVVTDDTEETWPTGAYGGSVVGSKIQFVSNMGKENALSVGLSAFQLKTADGVTKGVPLTFNSSQQATDGDGATADVIVYDSLGSPLRVRITTVLEATTSSEATFRWIATSPDQRLDNSFSSVLGSGVIKTDSKGKVLPQVGNEVSLTRVNIPGSSPLAFTLDFAQVTGLDEGTNSLNASSQDGFPAGTLSSFLITETGRIQGVFSNGSTRDLGQILMARFSNNAGLEQKGDNLFAASVNSGDPVINEPGEKGNGTITSGAVELSNTDIGQNLIELITASTQYRGGARVITAVQQLLDELLNLRR